MANYEINIAKKHGEHYGHFFATASRSITDKVKLRTLLADFQKMYPEPDFKINITHYKTVGENIDIDDDGVMREKISFHSGYTQLYALDTQKVILKDMFDYDKEVVNNVVKMWNNGDDLHDINQQLKDYMECTEEQRENIVAAFFVWINEIV